METVCKQKRMGIGMVVDEECWSEVNRRVFETPNSKQNHKLDHNAAYIV
jgi:hypothetical protein